jgi:hypothetical protein
LILLYGLERRTRNVTAHISQWMVPFIKLIPCFPFAAGGPTEKTVCEVLGVTRSAVVVKRNRSSYWRDGRRAPRTPADLRLSAYSAVLRRRREETGAPCINHECVYRLMRELLLRRPGMREIVHGKMIA